MRVHLCGLLADAFPPILGYTFRFGSARDCLLKRRYPDLESVFHLSFLVFIFNSYLSFSEQGRLHISTLFFFHSRNLFDAAGTIYSEISASIVPAHVISRKVNNIFWVSNYPAR